MGYGETPPYADWPNGAKIAVQVVLNFEEGGENCILHGDESSEAFLSEIPNAKPFIGERHMNMESIYEYGARAGFCAYGEFLPNATFRFPSLAWAWRLPVIRRRWRR